MEGSGNDDLPLARGASTTGSSVWSACARWQRRHEQTDATTRPSAMRLAHPAKPQVSGELFRKAISMAHPNLLRSAASRPEAAFFSSPLERAVRH